MSSSSAVAAASTPNAAAVETTASALNPAYIARSEKALLKRFEEDQTGSAVPWLSVATCSQPL